MWGKFLMVTRCSSNAMVDRSRVERRVRASSWYSSASARRGGCGCVDGFDVRGPGRAFGRSSVPVIATSGQKIFKNKSPKTKNTDLQEIFSCFIQKPAVSPSRSNRANVSCTTFDRPTARLLSCAKAFACQHKARATVVGTPPHLGLCNVRNRDV